MPQNADVKNNAAGRRWLRSVGALLLGFLFVVAVSLATDQLLHATGIFPPWGQPMSDRLFLVATAYRLVFGVAGSFITAWAAPRRPLLHAMIGGAIGTALAAAGAAATWNYGPEFGPHWYPVTLVVTGLPTAWLGGSLYRQKAVPSQVAQ